MGEWTNGIWHWTFTWRRPLLQREEDMIEELKNVVSSFPLRERTPDEWIWNKEDGDIFSVKSAFLLLQGAVEEHPDRIFSNLWSLIAPSNVLSLAWKILLNRVQSKENLLRRGIIQGTTQTLCSFCLHEVESTSHLFFFCKHSWAVWCCIMRWLGFIMITPKDASTHFMMFQDFCIGRDKKNGFGCIWLSTVWFIWHLRSRVLFNGEVLNWSRAIDSIQFRSWLWLKGKAKSFDFSLYEWSSNPLVCLESL